MTKLDSASKKIIIAKLTKSLDLASKPKFDLNSLHGAWDDSRSSDEIIEEIKEARIARRYKFLMKYLLDSNICIHYFRGKFGVIDELKEVGLNHCAISEITLAELIFGAENSDNPEQNHKIIQRFIQEVAILPILDSVLLYGREKTRLRRLGKMISDFNLLIGCTASEKGLIMVTENVREFDRITHLKIENWIVRA